MKRKPSLIISVHVVGVASTDDGQVEAAYIDGNVVVVNTFMSILAAVDLNAVVLNARLDHLQLILAIGSAIPCGGNGWQGGVLSQHVPGVLLPRFRMR